MDFEERYRIIQSRDPRFDGQFITAVRSTGIYCRPSCPARTPNPANVTFYETSAAAHEAGYRACKRCLPEAVPGTPAWNLRDDLSGRAMRLIADGVVEREGVHGLAARLGYSSRHLTRVLTQELGAGPLALARAHRAQTARTLLTSTELPIGDIAFAAGFASIRQFNDTVGEVFRLTPSELRARQSRHSGAAPGSIELALPYREPFDAAGVFAWLAARAVPGVESAGPAHFARTVLLPGGPGCFVVRHRAGRLLLEARLAALADLPVLVARIRRLFDLDADPVAIDGALRTAGGGVLVGRVEAVPGIRLPGAVDPHEMLVRAIIGQQISVPSARTLLHRLAVAAGTPFDAGTGADAAAGDDVFSSLTLLFPTAAQIAEHAGTVLTGPRAKIATVVAVAEALASGELELGTGDDAAQQHDRLVALPGIGEWTAGYLAMRILGRADVLLTGDVAIRAGARALGLPDAPRELAAWAGDFAPWRSYLSLHLWRAAADAPRTRTPSTPAAPRRSKETS
ncbi:Ada metal-binding domain-containing protein [Herbiconiux sp. KACC 21604]|uniref:DNA-3-methyladenine glycosylase 2 family protein n=1 Tax=unclassified Herbiconiux TaxID=2618217 RepID=UPI001491776A|nr:Ada metal-binding domain-containing protein [Herbiconiux sp. SALV-R1]QJU53206.1 DNA-3-methyladenine glycosylase 2 family protein [Herbiconiux sp. SALV-R1]WPO88156.1 Ada metal-binding domain-containing protein [Herbiconiux sp. KACC 21604]